ncbi:hypothetical protein [Variovorax paradoxus]|uniref:hypothetical protein n=1 Tax=Variovorax paradoxus TaxID=34073 RepID=UPI0027832F19|nr:hypothetical protein [Variovorax paradoxus]MDP9932589.1 hypothetical protein [Variovorax paradoxus]
MTLVARGDFPGNVFRLLGRDENSATFALGWTLEVSPQFASLFAERVAGRKLSATDRFFRLQQSGADKGFTDLEMRFGDELHAIVEAKVGWLVPSADQLRRYRPRLNEKGLSRSKLAMVSVSAATAEVARLSLAREIDGVRVQHLSWGDVRAIAKKARQLAPGFEEKLWLRELIVHLGEFAAMDRVRDNLVYVVSLGSAPMREGGSHTWIDVIEKDGSYFHPVGRGWPSQPPNYVAFRYRGRVRSVHRVESYEIFPDVSKKNRLWISTDSDHFVYKLGPAMRPTGELRAATPDDTVKRSARVWCAIDTLLSGEFKSLGDARDETKRRLAAAEAGAG